MDGPGDLLKPPNGRTRRRVLRPRRGGRHPEFAEALTEAGIDAKAATAGTHDIRGAIETLRGKALGVVFHGPRP
ncbi:hypothetical protein [Streptosporangium saharense]|uniref:hypothetical protein n=1 Tax=Streptosporangium saharense TaxID=1706840 RepID=UPI0034253C25